MRKLQEVQCTRHNLVFAFDAERVRALGLEPALMGCPACSREQATRLIAERTELQAHRELLLKAIDLKALLMPVAEA